MDDASPRVTKPRKRRRIARLVDVVVGRSDSTDAPDEPVASIRVPSTHTPVASASTAPASMPPDASSTHPPVAPARAAAPAPEPSETALDRVRALRRQREFKNLMHETYPSVAPMLVALSEEDSLEHADEWLTIARLLYDEARNRDRGLNAEARERAIRAAAVAAIEAQARSSARIAGFHDAELDNEWAVDPEWNGQRVWEHYLCRESILVRESLHGEALGNWLGAIGELWAATDELMREVQDRRALLRRPAAPVEESPPAPSFATPNPTIDISPVTETQLADVVEIINGAASVATISTLATITTRLDTPVEVAEIVDTGEETDVDGPEITDDEAPKIDPLAESLQRVRIALEAVKEAALW